jgi:hypothetical protein
MDASKIVESRVEAYLVQFNKVDKTTDFSLLLSVGLELEQGSRLIKANQVASF